ncbi:MAG: hypothetical protein ACE5HX_09525 [bacterium]
MRNSLKLYLSLFVFYFLLPFQLKSSECFAGKMELAVPSVVHAGINKNTLKKKLPERRLLLEKCFLLIQKKKLENIRNPSAKIIQFKRIIKLQLMIIERKLKRNQKPRVQQYYTLKF